MGRTGTIAEQMEHILLRGKFRGFHHLESVLDFCPTPD